MRQDRTNTVIKTLDKDLDIRDKWLGIRQLKQEYQPNPYARKTKEGKHIPQHQRAQRAAEYLATEQWGKKRKRTDEEEEEPTRKRTNKIKRTNDSEKDYNTEEITLEEIWNTLKKFKRRKAPGPDEIPIELFKEMNDESMKGVKDLLNQW